MLNRNYLRRIDHRAFEIIKKWQDFERRNNESIPDFWIRWREAKKLAKEQNALECESALYIKAYRALKLTAAQYERIDIMSDTYRDTLSEKDYDKPLTWKLLLRWPMKFAEDQKDKGIATRVIFHEDTGQPDLVGEQSSLHNDTFTLGPIHAKKATNKEGNEVSAIRATQTSFNYPNSGKKGTGFNGQPKRIPCTKMFFMWVVYPSSCPMLSTV